jgi:hypothetical protein
VRIIWSEIAQATFVRFMADQAGMMAVNRAVEALADDPAPLGAFVRGAYRRLRVGPYRVLYTAADKLAQCRVGITRKRWHWASVARPSGPSSGPNT